MEMVIFKVKEMGTFVVPNCLELPVGILFRMQQEDPSAVFDAVNWLPEAARDALLNTTTRNLQEFFAEWAKASEEAEK